MKKIILGAGVALLLSAASLPALADEASTADADATATTATAPMDSNMSTDMTDNMSSSDQNMSSDMSDDTADNENAE